MSSSSSKLWNSLRSARRTILAVAIIACALSLQGCQIPRHVVGYWEAVESYLISYAYSPPGPHDSASPSLLNSCTAPDVPSSLRCSGHGRCVEWFDDVGGLNNTDLRLSFCKCDQYWADPECRTERKSQQIAFVLAVALGLIGADQFYLGWWTLGVLKGISLGGCGIWYIFDIVRIGSSQVTTNENFRVANDLPYYAFVLTLVGWMGAIGFAISVWSIMNQRAKKALEILLLRAEASGSDQGSYEFQDKSIAIQSIPLMVSNAPVGGYGAPGAPVATMGGGYGELAPVSFHGYGTTISGARAGALVRI